MDRKNQTIKIKPLLIFIGILATLAFAEKPNLLLLKSYKNDTNVIGWLISEKLDGVRAYWNGKELISRSGKTFATPKWFTKSFPPFEIDGELWTKRGDFEHITSIVNKQSADEGWHDISYQIFEVPNQKGGLLKRLRVLEQWLKKNPNKFKGLVGALLCEWHGKVLKIGSGLSVEDRKIPPKVGEEVTFKYNGLTKYGNPKFPVFLRVRTKL